MIQIHTTKNKRINRASLEESTQRALTTHRDVKIPDGPIVIDKDLLKEIRDAFDNEAGDGNEHCTCLRDKLDNLYPFLMNISTNNPPVRLNPEEAIKLMDSLDEQKCTYCNGCGFLIDPTPSPFMGIPDTTTCWKCEGTGKNQ